MRHLFFFTVLLTLLASCGKTGYRYTKTGFKYKIIDGGGKDTLRHGDMIKMFFESRYEDSVLQSTNDIGYQLFPYDSNMTKRPYDVGEIFPMLKIGDSAVCVFSSDSIIRMQFGEKPPPGAVPDWLKKGKHFYMFVKVMQKYSDTALFNADRKKEFDRFQAYQKRMQDKAMADQVKKDSVGYKTAREEFDKFLGDKKNKLVKTASGAYVEILEPGTGAPCDSGKQASVRYRGTLLNGEEFDTNISKPGDTIQKPPFDVVIGQSPIIPGFAEGLKQLRGGSRAKLYVPAEAGYGNAPAGPKIKAYSNLIFEVTIENVTVPKPPPANMQMPGNPQQGANPGAAAPGHEGHNH